jgi:hypothetical protein
MRMAVTEGIPYLVLRKPLENLEPVIVQIRVVVIVVVVLVVVVLVDNVRNVIHENEI